MKTLSTGALETGIANGIANVRHTAGSSLTYVGLPFTANQEVYTV